jgi:hypothetical protein
MTVFCDWNGNYLFSIKPEIFCAILEEPSSCREGFIGLSLIVLISIVGSWIF